LSEVGHDVPGHRISGWRTRLEESPADSRIFDEGLAQMGRAAEAGEGRRHLIHGDTINRNVFVDGDRVSGVFDWGCGATGDHLYDLAWIDFWSPWHPQLADLGLRAAAVERWAEAGTTPVDLDERIRCCQLHIGLGHMAYYAWSSQKEHLERVCTQVEALMES
jgi:hygromycin-B 4-O-kinase